MNTKEHADWSKFISVWYVSHMRMLKVTLKTCKCSYRMRGPRKIFQWGSLVKRLHHWLEGAFLKFSTKMSRTIFSSFFTLKAPYIRRKRIYFSSQINPISKFEPVYEISNNFVCATSKGSDQPAHTRRLIRAFASRLSIV